VDMEVWVTRDPAGVCRGIIGGGRGPSSASEGAKGGTPHCGMTSHGVVKAKVKANNAYIIVPSQGKNMAFMSPTISLADKRDAYIKSILMPKTIKKHVFLFETLPNMPEEESR